MAFCPNCGNQIPDTTAFCTSCGSPMQAAAQSQQPQQQAYEQPAQQAYPQTYQQATQQQQAYQQPQQESYQQSAQQAYQQPSQQQAAYQQPQQAYQSYPNYQSQQAYQQPQAGFQQQAYQQPQQGYQQGFQQGQPYQQAVPAAIDNTAKYHSLGGWLLFFVIMEILGGISLLGSSISLLGSIGTLSSYGSNLMGAAVVSLIQSLFGLVFAVIFVLFLVKRNPNFLRMYQILSIVSMVIGIVEIVVTGTGGSLPGAATMMTAIFTVIFAALFLFLFTMYFCKSVRMRTYMGSTEYIDRALFKVGV